MRAYTSSLPAHGTRSSAWSRFSAMLRTPIRVVSAWNDDECMRLGAAVAFYAIFSLAPLLAMAVLIAGLVFGVDAAREQIMGQVGGLVGSGGGDTLQSMLDSAIVDSTDTKQWTTALVGFGTLFLGATGVFLELRNALDTINKETEEVEHGLSWMVKARIASFALVLAVGFVALVSLALSAAMAAVAEWLSRSVPILGALVLLLDTVISLSLITALFVLLLRFLPSIQPRKVSLWPGALLGAALFVVGKHVIGLYIGQAGVADAYGAAGSLVVILIWVFYSSQVLLLGAEYNRIRADRVAARTSSSPSSAASR
jgi:membrane protein